MEAQAAPIRSIANGDWLSRERLRAYCAILIAFYLATILALAITSPGGGVDYQGRPLGTDFSNVWTAGKLALDGAPEAAYDVPRHFAVQQEAFGSADIPYYGWHYPPVFLIVAALTALAPYLTALVLWQSVTFWLYLRAVWSILPRPGALLVAAAFPAVLLNVLHGHNGFLSAALLGGGLALLDRRPWTAGVLLGLLVYKPQFGLLAPLALAIGGRWRTFASAAATVIVLALLTTAIFGPDVWSAFAHSMTFTRTIVLEQGGPGFHKMQSLFAAIRLWGGSIPVAYLGQGAATLAAALLVVFSWRGQADQRLKSAVLICACLAATPYSLDYDLMMLAPAGLFLASVGLERGFNRYEITLLAACFAVPIMTRPVAAATLAPLGMLATAALLAHAARLSLRRQAHLGATDRTLPSH